MLCDQVPSFLPIKMEGSHFLVKSLSSIHLKMWPCPLVQHVMSMDGGNGVKGTGTSSIFLRGRQTAPVSDLTLD